MTQESPFAVLGLPVRFDLSRAELEARWKELSKAFHPDRHQQKSPAERRAALTRAVAVNEAYRRLKDELTRAQAILELRGETGGEAADPELLMEVMELREALSERKAEGDLPRIEALAAHVQESSARAHAQLGRALDETQDAQAAHVALGRLRYFRRFLDEVELAREALTAG